VNSLRAYEPQLSLEVGAQTLLAFKVLISPLSGQVALGSTAASRATRSPTMKRRKAEKPAFTAEVAFQNVKLSQPRGSPQGVSALKTAICEGNLGDTGDTVSA